MGTRRGEEKTGGRGNHPGLDQVAEIDTAHCVEPLPTQALNTPFLPSLRHSNHVRTSRFAMTEISGSEQSRVGDIIIIAVY